MQTIIQGKHVDNPPKKNETRKVKIKSLKNWILELLFPSFCLGCKEEGTLLCHDCQATLEVVEYRYCLCNKNPQRIPAENPNGRCSRCQSKKLSGLYFALPYQENLITKKLIHQFKYEPYLKTLAKPLAQLLAIHFVLTHQTTNDFWSNSFLIPVPLENSKLRLRGYNQSELLARQLGQIINVPTRSDVLIKIKKTQAQMTLSAQERQENLRGAFAIKNAEALRGKKIFLVDDVYTTGATLEECAMVLKEAGARHVFGICLAREA